MSEPLVIPETTMSIPTKESEIALVRGWYEGHPDAIIIEELAHRSAQFQQQLANARKEALDSRKLILGALIDRIDMAPNDDPIPYIREYVMTLIAKEKP